MRLKANGASRLASSALVALAASSVVLFSRSATAHIIDSDEVEYRRELRESKKQSLNENPTAVSITTSSNQRKMRIGDPLIDFSLPPIICSSFVTSMTRSVATFEAPLVYDITDNGVMVLLPLVDLELRRGVSDEVVVPFNSEFLVRCNCITATGVNLIGIRRATFLPRTQEDRDRKEVKYD